MKKRITFVLGLLLIFSITGCITTTQITEDFLENYSAFLDYSLGEYTLLETTRGRRGASMGFWANNVIYQIWRLEYTDHDGETRIFRFTNGDRLGGMENQVLAIAREIGNDTLRRDIVYNYFAPEEYNFRNRGSCYIEPSFRDLPYRPKEFNVELPTLVEVRMHTPQEVSNVLSTESGLQLYSVTPHKLIAEWGFSVSISLSTNDYENYVDQRERFKEMTRTLADYLELDEIRVSFVLRHLRTVRLEDGRTSSQPCKIISREYAAEISFFGVYNRRTDTFEVTTRQEQQDEAQVTQEEDEYSE